MGKAPVLPPDVLTEILSRVPAESLVRLKCVCKSWYRLISDEDFVRAHLEHWRSAARALVSLDGLAGGRVPKIVLLTLNLYGQAQSYCGRICLDGLVDALPLRMPVHTDDNLRLQFLDSCDGLLLLGVRLRPTATAWELLLVCNPITKWYMLLPPCPSLGIGFRWRIASDDPVRRYKIIGIRTYVRSESPSGWCFNLEFRQGGPDSWKELPADKGEDRFVYKTSSREWRGIGTPCRDPSTSVLNTYSRPRHVNSLVGCGRRRKRITC